MALLSLTSSNPDMSFVIGKNPASGVLAKEVRLGFAFGFFSKGRSDQYNIWFKDSDTEVSYKSYPDESFEYVNTSRFNSAMFIINALSDFLAAATKKLQDKDVAGFDHVLKINLMYVENPKYFQIFRQYFEDFTLVEQEIGPKNYMVTIHTNRTIRDLLNYANLFAIFNVIKNEADYINIDEPTIAKYMAALNVLDAPYFLRYVFKVNLLRGKGKFEKFRKDLETTKRYEKIQMVLGNTGQQRETIISEKLGSLENQILDIGCGEGNYIRKLAGKLPDGVMYLAVDKDEGCRSDVDQLVARKKLENVQIFASCEELPTLKEKTDVLMVEVIEHMPMDDAKALVKSVFAGKVNIGKLLITTPNKAFNQFYDLHEEHTRHDDHHFELTEPEFKAFLDETVPFGYTTELFYIGDLVNGIPTTFGARIMWAEDYSKMLGVQPAKGE